MNKELVNYHDKLYWVYRKVNQTRMKQEFISEIKEHWLCDLVVRDRNSENPNLLFLREISDAVIVKNLL
jgi:hypothetical protein